MSHQLNSVKGSVNLVTAAANGLGQTIVKTLVNEGADGVVAFDTRFDSHQHFHNNNVIEISGNIGEESDVSKAIDVCRERFGRLDNVINCTGADTIAVEESDPLQEFRRVFDANISGPFNVIRLAAPLMADNRPINGCRGVIINISMVPGIDSQRSVAYSSTSGAIASMTLPLARDLANQCVRCVTIEVCQASDNHPLDQSLALDQSIGHLVQRVIENPMMNGEVIKVDGGLRHAIPPKL